MQPQIRTMTAADVAVIMRLKTEAGWNQTESDCRRFLALSPEGCFVAEAEGRGVATVLALRFGPVAWIAMMIVDQTLRGGGLGGRMMRHALEWCDAQGVAAVRLDATPLGRPVYAKLGFVDQYPLTRFEGVLPHAEPGAHFAGVVRPTSIEDVVPLDSGMPGTDRRALLEGLWRENPAPFHLVPGRGFGASRPGTQAAQIGPVVAADADAGLLLLDRIAASLAGSRVYIDIPDANAPATSWARSRGLTPQRPLYRMIRGVAPEDRVERLFASAGPETG